MKKFCRRFFVVKGHEKDCSALALAKLDSYDYRYDEENPIELREMHGENRYRILGYGATKYNVLDLWTDGVIMNIGGCRKKWRQGRLKFI